MAVSGDKGKLKALLSQSQWAEFIRKETLLENPALRGRQTAWKSHAQRHET